MNSLLSRVQQPIGGIDVDVVTRAFDVGIDHFAEHGEELQQGSAVLGYGEILADGFEEPERRVDGVVFRFATGVWEVIRQHSAIDIFGERQQNLPRHVGASGREREPGQRLSLIHI